MISNFSQMVSPKVAEPFVNQLGERIHQRLDAETKRLSIRRQRMICETVVAEFNEEQKRFDADVSVNPVDGCRCGRCGIALVLYHRTYH